MNNEISFITLQDRINSMETVLRGIYENLICLDFDYPNAEKSSVMSAFKASESVADAISILQQDADRLTQKINEYKTFQLVNGSALFEEMSA